MIKLTGRNISTSIPSPDIKEFSINFTVPGVGWDIHLSVTFYALCIVIGIVTGLWITNRRWRKRGAPSNATLDVTIWSVPFGLIGARLYHVVTSPDNYFGPQGSLANIPKMWEGGGGIWGAILFGGVAAAIVCRSKGLRFFSLADAAAPALLVGQGIGRWGNYFNQELYGRPTTLPWGLNIDHPLGEFSTQTTAFHPTFLYESVWCFIGALLLILLDRHFKFTRGRLFWLYAMYYTSGRFWIENLRVDPAQRISILGFEARLNTWVSLSVFFLSTIIFIILSITARGEKADGTSALLYDDDIPSAEVTDDSRPELLKEAVYSDGDLHGRNNDHISNDKSPYQYQPSTTSPETSSRTARRRSQRTTEELGNRPSTQQIEDIAIGNEYSTRKSSRPVSLEDRYNDSSLQGRAKDVVSAIDPLSTALTTATLPPPAYPASSAIPQTMPNAETQSQVPVKTRRERRKRN